MGGRLHSITIQQKTPEADSFHTFYFFNSCKAAFTSGFSRPRKRATETVPGAFPEPPAVAAKRVPFLTVHGTVQYDYYRRSRIDTPFQQSEFWQHTERVYASAWIKDKYPLRIGFTARQSNSPFFRNFNDLNVQFDRNAYLQRLRQKALARLEQRWKALPDLDKLAAELSAKRLQLQQLQQKRNSPANLQKLIEEREKELYGATRQNTYSIETAAPAKGIPAFTFPGQFKFSPKAAPKVKAPAIKEPEWSDRAIDSVSAEVARLQQRFDSVQSRLQAVRTRVTRLVNTARDPIDLARIEREAGVSADTLSRLQNALAHLTQISVGRSLLDYTELTARNITISGVNLEYQDRYYAAFAAGKIDYRYRDFFNRNSSSAGQYLVLGRFGFRKGENRAFIFTVFQGRKNRSEFALSDTVRNLVPVLGYSFQAIIRKDAFTGFSAEFAKSTYPVMGSRVKGQEGRALFSFGDRSNNGVNLKGETRIPQTNTRLSGFYRVTGENFQSFSLLGTNSHQTAWQGKLEQDFSKRHLTLTAAVRQNDFANLFAERTYKASTVFKSLQVQARFPKYPSLSLGYYPGTQLFLIDKERVQESAFYIVNGTLSYNYQAGGTQMNSLLVYNRYITEATDSGFSAYRGIQYSVVQTVFFRKLQVQGSYARSVQPQLVFSSYDASLDAHLGKVFRLGAGLRWNHTHTGLDYWGQSVLAGVDYERWGGLRLQYEKAFFPTIRNGLEPVEIGSLSWYKTF